MLDRSLLRSCVILGTDTGCGKTHTSVTLLRQAAQQQICAIGMKPVATGWNPSSSPETQEDIAALREWSHPTPPLTAQCSYLFAPPISPHLAARQAAIAIAPEKIRADFLLLSGLAECIIVESAGGCLTPLSDTLDMIDLPLLLNLPAILVVDIQLGCINRARLNAAVLRNKNVPMLGWVANTYETPEHPKSLCQEEVIESLAHYLDFPRLYL